MTNVREHLYLFADFNGNASGILLAFAIDSSFFFMLRSSCMKLAREI